MSDSRVTKFNFIKGDAPVGLKSKASFWEQAQNQAGLVLEEAKEQYEAAWNEDLLELLDGAMDIRYVQTHMEDIIEAVGISLSNSFDEVCKNNTQKFTTNSEFALDSLFELNNKGERVNLRTVEYEGDTYYMIKRNEDGKVMKLLNHQSPDLRSCIPDETFNFLSGD